MAQNTVHPPLSALDRTEVTYFVEKIMRQIYEFYDNQDLIDVTFQTSNPEVLIPAHRLILAVASPYFKDLFNSDEGTAPVIQINDIDGDTFERLVTFCYTGQALLTEANVDAMLKGSIILRLDDAIEKCAEFLVAHMADYTLRKARLLATETGCAILNERITDYAIKNFMELSQSDDFVELPPDQLQRIIENDELNVNCEADVLWAVQRWYEHDAPVRQQQLPDLVGSLRLTQFDTNFLLTNIFPLPGCEPLATKSIALVNTPSLRSHFSIKFGSPRKMPKQRGEEISWLAVQKKRENSLGVKFILRYNKAEDEWQKCAGMEIGRYDFGVVLLENCLICIGGWEDNWEASNSVNSFNLATKTMSSMLPMEKRRTGLSVVQLDGRIYAIGGRDEKEKELNSVEMFDSSAGKWQSVADMSVCRCGNGVVVFNGNIFVIGGWNAGYSSVVKLSSVERYNPTTNTWTRCGEMNKPHSYPGVAVHNGYIYALGSCGGNTVERYDSELDEWTMICSLNVARRSIYSVSFGDQLWAFGGFDGSSDTVEVYDEDNDEWLEKNGLRMGGVYSCHPVPTKLVEELTKAK